MPKKPEIPEMSAEQILSLETRVQAFAQQKKLPLEAAKLFLQGYALDRMDALKRFNTHYNEQRAQARRDSLAPCAHCKKSFRRAELAIYRGRLTLCAPCLMKATGALPLPIPVAHPPEPPLRQPHEEPETPEPDLPPPGVSPWLDRAKAQLSALGLTREEGEVRASGLLAQAGDDRAALLAWWKKHRVKLPHADSMREEVARVGRKKTEQTKKQIKEKVILQKGKKK